MVQGKEYSVDGLKALMDAQASFYELIDYSSRLLMRLPPTERRAFITSKLWKQFTVAYMNRLCEPQTPEDVAAVARWRAERADRLREVPSPPGAGA